MKIEDIAKRKGLSFADMSEKKDKIDVTKDTVAMRKKKATFENTTPRKLRRGKSGHEVLD